MRGLFISSDHGPSSKNPLDTRRDPTSPQQLPTLVPPSLAPLPRLAFLFLRSSLLFFSALNSERCSPPLRVHTWAFPPSNKHLLQNPPIADGAFVCRANCPVTRRAQIFLKKYPKSFPHIELRADKRLHLPPILTTQMRRAGGSIEEAHDNATAPTHHRHPPPATADPNQRCCVARPPSQPCCDGHKYPFKVAGLRAQFSATLQP